MLGAEVALAWYRSPAASRSIPTRWRASSTSPPRSPRSLAIRFSAKPADANHPYGHHKAEYFSVVLEGVLIVIAAISIFREAWLALPRRRA